MTRFDVNEQNQICEVCKFSTGKDMQKIKYGFF